jgi:hypothetical protein
MNEKLLTIQSELKAPKGIWNKFSGFYYRSAESILEAVKPLLKEQGLTIVLSDSFENHGNRYYVKATVTISDGDKEISATAYAREQDIKKGMDESQITGSASSYARKYALNGLFAIDDTQDADTQDNKAEPLVNTPATVKIASAVQKVELNTLMTAKNMDSDAKTLFVESVIEKSRVETEDDYKAIKEALELK